MDDSQWSNSDRRVAAFASSNRLAQHLFLPQSSILDRNIVNPTVNCGVNSISDDSQEILCLCACLRTHACLMVVCVFCACVRARVMSFGAEVQRKTAEPSLSLPGDPIGGVLSG